MINIFPDNPQLGEVARLDTCVTVVDSAEFYSNLGSMDTYEQGDTDGTIAELMVEQVECADVVVLNKGDLVSEEQQSDIVDKVALLNPKAKVVKCVQSRINVMDIVNTRLYKTDKFEKDFWVPASKARVRDLVAAAEEELPDCCEQAATGEGEQCCNKEKTRDSGLSQV